jgi:hypothetical protein
MSFDALAAIGNEGCKEPGRRSGGKRRRVAGGAAGAREGRTRRSRVSGGTEHARRSLSMAGALRGIPAEGVGRDLRLDRRGRHSPSNPLICYMKTAAREAI